MVEIVYSDEPGVEHDINDESTRLIRSANDAVSTSGEASSSHELIPWKQAVSEYLGGALPFGISGVISVGGTFVGIYVLSKQGPENLSASAIFLPYQALISMAGNSALFSVGNYLSKAIGALDKPRWEALDHTVIGKIFREGLLISLCYTGAGLFVAATPQLYLPSLGIDKKVSDLAQQALYGAMPGLPAVLSTTLITQLALGKGDGWLLLLTMLVNTGLTIGLSFPLVDSYGALGYGLATSAAAWGALFLPALSYLVKSKKLKDYKIFSSFDINYKNFKRMLAEGFPNAVQMILEEGAFVFIAMMLNQGKRANTLGAAYGVVNQYMIPSMAWGFCLSQAGSLEVSKKLGLKQFLSARKRMLPVSIGMTGITSLALGAGFYFGSDHLIEAFYRSSEPDFDEILSVGNNVMLYAAIGMFLNAIRNAAAGGLRGYHKTFFPMMAIAIGSLIVIGSGIGLDFATPYGALFGRMIGVGFSAVAMFTKLYNQPLEFDESDSELEVDDDESRPTPVYSFQASSSTSGFFDRRASQDEFHQPLLAPTPE